MKLRKTFRGNLKAVSPVISTIIIVAIAITMSIAVAYWLLGLGGSFTKFEKVEYTSAYVTGSGNQTGTDPYIVHMGLKNTGSATATVDSDVTLYNGQPAIAYTPAVSDWIAVNTGYSLTMVPGNTTFVTITLSQPTLGSIWVSGMTVEIMLHTTGGKDYPKALVLP